MKKALWYDSNPPTGEEVDYTWRCPPYEVYQNLSHGSRCEVVKKGFEKLHELQEQARQLSRDLESLVWGME